ncbi:A-kinase anchor protein 7 isoform X1 [Conger conger]|uniref:A-kinase anchor protein 7 isoform X1 n=1 Tax=Conger conger TaxID=82655 RepID=UPI002A59F769|nr:A-kinase anchor protein 7 isoform X1 [Conger conger]
MIPLLLLQTRKITAKLARQNLQRVFDTLPGGQVNLTEKVVCQSYGLSKLPQGQVHFTGTQTVSCSETDIHVVEVEASMERDCDHLPAHAPNALVDITTEEDCLQSRPCCKARIDPEPSDSKKRERRKPKKARVRGRKPKAKSLECADSLLQELPFANAETWKDLGFMTSEKPSEKKRKRGDSGRGESEEDGDKKKKKKQPRPNYFVSIPITNPKIRDGIQAVQDLVLQKDEQYSRALIPVGSLHITLLVTYLSNEEEVEAARRAVAEMEQTFRDLLQGRELVLPFFGIGNFRNEVAFVQLAEGAHVSTLTEVAEAVRKVFEERGVSSGDGKAFKPHLTFMKLSRAPKLRSKGIRKIDPEAYESFLQHSFGEETVSRLDLCSMLKKKTPDGYYHCETSVTFGAKHDSGFFRKALQTQTGSLSRRLDGIKALLSQPAVRARIIQELTAATGQAMPNADHQGGDICTPPGREVEAQTSLSANETEHSLDMRGPLKII